MPREEEPKKGAPEWMCTFSDMMSLLLCFFVLLFSLSTIEKKKMIQASGSLRKAFGGLPAPYITENIPDKHTEEELSRPNQMIRRKFYGKMDIVREEQKKVKSKELQDVIQVTGTEQGITFRVSGDALFQVGNYELANEADALVALEFINNELIRFASNPVHIKGHTDASGEAENNWILGARRSFEILKFFRDIGTNLGRVSPNRMSYESFGEYDPISSNETAVGQALNRRVDITLVQTDTGFGTYFDDPTTPNPRTPLMTNEPENPGGGS